MRSKILLIIFLVVSNMTLLSIFIQFLKFRFCKYIKNEGGLTSWYVAKQRASQQNEITQFSFYLNTLSSPLKKYF